MIALIFIKYIILIHKVYSIIFLPFQITEIDYLSHNYSINSLIDDLFYRDIYTIIYIGTPLKEVLTLVRPDNHTLFLNKNDCQRKKLKYLDKNSVLNNNKVFDYKESSTFKIISTINDNYNNKDFNYLVTDSISFYDINCKNINSNCDKTIKIDEFHFNIEKEYNNKLCGRLGIGYSKNTQDHIINQLKKNKGSNYYIMIINFLEDGKGRIIFGGYPHEYDNNTIYDKNDLITINTGSIGNIFLPWSISFIRTYFITEEQKEILVQKYALCYIIFNFGLIKGTGSYKEFILEYFFQNLIDKKICKIGQTDKTIFDRKASSINSDGIFTMFTCDSKTFKYYINKFPSFKLKHEGFNYTFELTYKDLFLEVNDIYYFLIIFPGDHSSQWIFGIPFLKKYEFVYNYDSNTIGFYHNYIENREKIERNKLNETKDENNVDNSQFINITFKILFCIILIGIGYYIGKKIHEHRKKKVYELKEEDDYDYIPENQNNKKNNIPLIKKNNIEKENISNNNKILEMSIRF